MPVLFGQPGNSTPVTASLTQAQIDALVANWSVRNMPVQPVPPATSDAWDAWLAYAQQADEFCRLNIDLGT
jgi:hypothetical protein